MCGFRFKDSGVSLRMTFGKPSESVSCCGGSLCSEKTEDMGWAAEGVEIFGRKVRYVGGGAMRGNFSALWGGDASNEIVLAGIFYASARLVFGDPGFKEIFLFAQENDFVEPEEWVVTDL